MHIATTALLVSTWAATLCVTSAFSTVGQVMPTALQKAALSRHIRSSACHTSSATGLSMGFLDNIFKPKVSSEDPVWMQRDFKANARKDGAWEEFVDDASGEKYYFNTATQETLWEAEYAYFPPLCSLRPLSSPHPTTTVFTLCSV